MHARALYRTQGPRNARRSILSSLRRPRRWCRGSGLAVLGVAVFVVLPGAVAQTALPSDVTIASEGARPPYNYFGSDRRLAGFEIELGHDLCRRMKVSCTFVSQTWDDMIPGLLAHQYDAIMAAMEINAQRQVQIAFSVPYVRLPSAFLVRKDTDIASDSPDAFAGRRIGVERGGTHEAFLQAVYPRATIMRYGALSDAILDLEAGRVDAAIGDKDAIMTFLETRRDADCCRILADVPRYPAYFGDGIGVGLRKEDTVLKAAFDRAILAAMADGTFSRISARYFDFPINGPVDPSQGAAPDGAGLQGSIPQSPGSKERH